MAYCWEKHSGYTYLKRENAAICVGSRKELKKRLKEICRHPEQIQQYAYNAYQCGKKNHERVKVQCMLKNDFESIIHCTKESVNENSAN